MLVSILSLAIIGGSGTFVLPLGFLRDVPYLFWGVEVLDNSIVWLEFYERIMNTESSVYFRDFCVESNMWMDGLLPNIGISFLETIVTSER